MDYTQLNTSYTDKLIGSQKIKIKFFNELDQIKDCHLLFVSEEKMKDIDFLERETGFEPATLSLEG